MQSDLSNHARRRSIRRSITARSHALKTYNKTEPPFTTGTDTRYRTNPVPTAINGRSHLLYAPLYLTSWLAQSAKDRDRWL